MTDEQFKVFMKKVVSIDRSLAVLAFCGFIYMAYRGFIYFGLLILGGGS